MPACFGPQTPCRCVYGSYQVRQGYKCVSVFFSAKVLLCFENAVAGCRGKRNHQKAFVLTSFRKLRTFLVLHAQYIEQRDADLGLILAWRCRQLSLVFYDTVHFYLKALLPVPHSPVDFQLWVANQDNPEKDLHTGTHTPGGSMPAAVSTL